MRRLLPPVSALLVTLLPCAALAERGVLAPVNIGTQGWDVAQKAARELGDLVGGWARQAGISAFLAGRPSPGSLPAGDTGEDLVRQVEHIRTTRSPDTGKLAALGRLLGVDYLLLLQIRPATLSARLFSVRLGAYAPQGFEGKPKDTARLKAYVLAQTRASGGEKKTRVRWWIWAIAGVVAAVTVGLALGLSDSNSGDLRIQVHR
jgi:hypothetical protein